MSEQTSCVADLVAEIVGRLPALDANRRQMFFRWLQVHHHSDVRVTGANLEQCLTAWLGTLPIEGTNWEYNLILNEIAWWRDLDERSLAEFMRSERTPDVQDHILDGSGNE